MTAYVVLECDARNWDCDVQYDSGANDEITARRWAKGDGWHSAGAEDFCPKHADEAKR